MGRKKREMSVSANERSTLARVQEVMDQYADSPLECDGLTNVLHFYLTRAQIGHRVMEGRVENAQGKEGIPWHRWIAVQAKVGPVVVDYRARMWLGARANVPHGVFLASSNPYMCYQGREIEPLPLPEGVIHFMVERPDLPQEWRKKYHL